MRLEGATSLKSSLVSFQYYLTIYHRFWLSVPLLNPHNRHTVTIFGGRCRQYPIDGMLLLDLHNSSHHTQPHSIIVQYMKYLWLNKVLNRRGKLWTCFHHVKAGSRNIITLITSEPLHHSRYVHYNYFQSGELISLILPINCECGQL